MADWICEQCGEPFASRGAKRRRFCKRACADAWAARDVPDAATLYTWYWDERLTANDIARKVGRDSKRVWEWLKAAGIETRPRGGTSSSGSFSPGQPSAFKGRVHTTESRANMREARLRVPRGAYAGNGHYLRERTGPAHPNWKGGLTPERQAFYSSPEWKATARAVWTRDQCTCQRCGCKPPRKGPKHNRGHVHHIVSFQVRELRLDLGNLVLLCAGCHRWVHGRANVLKELVA